MVKIVDKNVFAAGQHGTLSDAARMDQVGGDQFFQVMRDRRLGDRELGHQLFAGDFGLDRDSLQDRETLWVSQRLGYPMQLLVGQPVFLDVHNRQSIDFATSAQSTHPPGKYV
jgi:hypothetical protein